MKKLLLALTLLFSTFASAGVVTLSGQAKDNSGVNLNNGRIVFTVMNCASAPIRSDTGATVTKSVTQTLDATGNLSGTVIGNDLIACGATSYYQVTATRSTGVLAWRRNYSITGTTFVVSSATTLATLPAVPSVMSNPLTTAGDLPIAAPFGVPTRFPIIANNTCLGASAGSWASMPCTLVLGKVSLATQTAAITTTNLVPTAPVGQWVVQYYIDSTVVCATPGPATTTLTIAWTDEVGARTATATLALGATVTAPTQGSFILWNTSAANNITYAASYVACTSGTGTFSLRLSARQIQ